MLGAIGGDLVGSRFEGRKRGIKTVEFDLFHEDCDITDDTVLTAATAEAILRDTDYSDSYREWHHRYPSAGFGSRFREWTRTAPGTVAMSFGNGAAMRVSPIGWAFPTLERVLEEAENSASQSHAHPEGIKAAQATAAAVFLARTGHSKEEIQRTLQDLTGYDLTIPVTEIRHRYSWSSESQDSVPQALRCFLEASSWEDAVRLAVSLGADSDTQAAIAGGVAEAAFGIEDRLRDEILSRLDRPILNVVTEFRGVFGPPQRP